MPLVMVRAGLRGRLEDYQDALARSEAWLAAHARRPDGAPHRVQALSRVHRFADARALLPRLQTSEDLAVTIDEATGHFDALGARARAGRHAAARA